MWNALRCGLSRVQIPSLKRSCIRHYMKTSEKMAILLKQSDHVPFHCELVYRHKNYKMGGMTYHAVNFLACFTVVSASYHIYTHGFKSGEHVPDMFKIIDNRVETAIVFIFSAATVIFASVMRSRYVIRIYYDQKKKMYKAIFTGKLPFTIEHHDFPAKCLTHVARESIFPWRNTLFYANSRKIMLFDEDFRTRGDFYAMLHPTELENSNESNL